MKIEVLFPTPTEARDFRRAGVGTHVSGVGIAATAYSTLKIIQSRQPDWLILAGVAGVYPHAGLKVGEVVLVESEVEGDLGFFTPDGFTHLAHLPAAAPFATARSMTLNAALAPFVDASQVEIENMEGGAFFHVCQQERVRFLELRAISNVVRLGHDDWDVDGAVQALTRGLHQLVDHLQDTQ